MGGSKNKKTAYGQSCFFGLTRKVPKFVYYDFRVIWGVHFGALERPEFIFLYFCVSDAPPWNILGPLSAPFGSYVGATFGVAFALSGLVFWDSFGPRSSFKRASRSLAKAGLCFSIC